MYTVVFIPRDFRPRFEHTTSPFWKCFAKVLRSYIDANDLNGIFVSFNGVLSMLSGATNLNTITNHSAGGDFGVRATEGARAINATSQTYPVGDNDTDHSADAATFATET